MKNKKNSLRLFIIVMAATLGISFMSCGKDEKNEIGEESLSSIVGTWRNDWGDDSTQDYTAYSFFEDGTGVEFDKGNGAERFSYTYDTWSKIVHIKYNEYQEWDMVISKLTSNLLVMDGEEYQKAELTNDMLILGEWLIHVDTNNYVGKCSRVMFYHDGTYEAKDYSNEYNDELYYSFRSLKGKVSGTYAINKASISIKGQSQIAGEYIIDGLVVNGFRFIRAGHPNEYPYLIGGYHDR